MKIETKGADGKPTGYLVPIWHVDDGPKIEQVYLTVIAPGCKKGPHLHKKRTGRFVCIAGNAAVVYRTYDYEAHAGEVGYHFVLLSHDVFEVTPGTAAELLNLSRLEPAYVLNTPSPPWRPDDQDEWPVVDWNYSLNEIATDTLAEMT